MPRPSLGRTLAAVVVSLTLATPWCAAAVRQNPPSSGQVVRPTVSTLPDLAHHLWGWLTERWTKAGCTIDPGGFPLCQPAPKQGPGTYKSNAEEGCSIDPGGLFCL